MNTDKIDPSKKDAGSGELTKEQVSKEELSEKELEKTTGGVVQAGWNLAQNKKSA